MAQHSNSRDEDGQISVLILGMTVIVLTLIVGALAVTSVQISRMRLLDAADTAALDATDEDVSGVYEGNIGRAVPVTDAGVQKSATESLASRELPPGLLSWQVAGGTRAEDGDTAVVVLTGEADLPLVGGLLEDLGGSVTVTVESRARADVASGQPAP